MLGKGLILYVRARARIGLCSHFILGGRGEFLQGDGLWAEIWLMGRIQP